MTAGASLVMPVSPRRQGSSAPGAALAVGVCFAVAVALATAGPGAPSELTGRAFTDTRGYSGTENVFEDGYKKPVLGHWISSDSAGHLKWVSGKEYVAAYGTDSVSKGLFLGHTKHQIRQAPSLVGTFGIDSNVFASNYKAPTNHDHIGVAMVHTDSKKANSKKAESKEAEKKAAHLTLLSDNVFDKNYDKPKEGHWVANPDRKGEMMWIKADEYAQGGYSKPSHKPRIVSPGPSTVSAFGIDSNIFASNYQKPKAWSHDDHIAVAMVHVADSKASVQNAAEGPSQKESSATDCGVGAVCNPF